ncbi:hypothetical protein D3C78_1393900 [compost metagenome]
MFEEVGGRQPLLLAHHVALGEHGVHRLVGERRDAAVVVEIGELAVGVEIAGHQHQADVLHAGNAQDQGDEDGAELLAHRFQRRGERLVVQRAIVNGAEQAVVFAERQHGLARQFLNGRSGRLHAAYLFPGP